MTRLTPFDAVVELWDGRLPLARAFWKHAVLYGAIANLAATVGALFNACAWPAGRARTTGASPSASVRPATIVGVYRSADHYAGPPRWARLAETAVVIWAALMILV